MDIDKTATVPLAVALIGIVGAIFDPHWTLGVRFLEAASDLC